ncbi:TrgA family protein [Roseovarius autotrophicus]|uniref:TrgA family protein n=1 Tax=Roseovarius autotrophicus TaxID=2824121 RepID=UPI0019EC6DE5|nr:TrgA family protein [Roseovarius autotrophicus]MBE0454448.1 TrgA family protein [Roseovarius sp.]
MPLTDEMPTAGKIAAAIGLGIVGWIGSELFRPLMPPDTNFGWFNYVNLGLGALCGWRVTGRRLGHGYATGISAGLTGVAALVFWALFFQSLNEMLRLALDRRITGLMTGLTKMFELGADYVVTMLDGTLIGVLLAGGFLVGVISEWVARRWS